MEQEAIQKEKKKSKLLMWIIIVNLILWPIAIYLILDSSQPGQFTPGIQTYSILDSFPNITPGQKDALVTALNYLNTMPFSCRGLIAQLEYEGFTRDDAVFAAQNCGANWKEQALIAAQNYLSVSAFSKKGLIEQLKYDGYTQDQAEYAANNCGADWNEQAALAAKNYLSIMPFTKEELIEQLKYDGFTQNQAIYGAKANGYK